jgi:hypothetical protein
MIPFAGIAKETFQIGRFKKLKPLVLQKPKALMFDN